MNKYKRILQLVLLFLGGFVAGTGFNNDGLYPGNKSDYSGLKGNRWGYIG